jgi:hypothetical protein
MTECSKDHGVVIGSLNLNFGLFGGPWLNWRPGRALRRIVETVGSKSRGVVCGMLAPSRL